MRLCSNQIKQQLLILQPINVTSKAADVQIGR